MVTTRKQRIAMIGLISFTLGMAAIPLLALLVTPAGAAFIYSSMMYCLMGCGGFFIAGLFTAIISSCLIANRRKYISDNIAIISICFSMGAAAGLGLLSLGLPAFASVMAVTAAITIGFGIFLATKPYHAHIAQKFRNFSTSVSDPLGKRKKSQVYVEQPSSIASLNDRYQYLDDDMTTLLFSAREETPGIKQRITAFAQSLSCCRKPQPQF